MPRMKTRHIQVGTKTKSRSFLLPSAQFLDSLTRQHSDRLTNGIAERAAMRSRSILFLIADEVNRAADVTCIDYRIRLRLLRLTLYRLRYLKLGKEASLF